MAITAHWIARDAQTAKLVLKTALIAFNHAPGNHTGKALAARCLANPSVL